MDLTTSWQRALPAAVRDRYQLAETRSAAGYLQACAGEAFADLIGVLAEFRLTLADLTTPGGSKSPVAARLDRCFRVAGWREAQHDLEFVSRWTVFPHRPAGEAAPTVEVHRVRGSGHRVDNVKGKVALEVEWNAKDGNLDRDLANFRALHEAGVIDVGVIVTRSHERIHYAANYLSRLAGRLAAPRADGQPAGRFATTTTTNIEKLIPRLQRGDAGGCPVLAVAFTDRCYAPGPGDPALPIAEEFDW